MPEPDLTFQIIPYLRNSEFALFQSCGSGMFVPDPDFFPNWIPDPITTTTKEEGKNKLVLHTLLINLPKFWGMILVGNNQS